MDFSKKASVQIVFNFLAVSIIFALAFVILGKVHKNCRQGKQIWRIFRPLGGCVCWADFGKYRSSAKLRATFFTGSVCLHIHFDNEYILGDFI
jgi:cytochrome c oxidase assembly factor CtaG